MESDKVGRNESIDNVDPSIDENHQSIDQIIQSIDQMNDSIDQIIESIMLNKKHDETEQPTNEIPLRACRTMAEVGTTTIKTTKSILKKNNNNDFCNSAFRKMSELQ